MKLANQAVEQEIEAVMEQGREIRPTPDVVRARLLSRARSAFAASKSPPAVIPSPSISTLWRSRRIAIAAGLLLTFATVTVAAAFHARVTVARGIAPMPLLVPDPPAIRASPDGLPAGRRPQAISLTRIQRPHRSISRQESYAAELRLLQRAQSEYASHDFTNALLLLAEHGRRFPNGRLAEEREALRVESLARAGRNDEARRALASFVNRFPHSAFLPRLQSAPRSVKE